MLHYNLPVYKACYDLLLEIFVVVKNYKREYKYTLGERMKDAGIDMGILIYSAARGVNEIDSLEQAIGKNETIRFLLRVSKDLKLISLQRYADISEKVENISKQLYGWQKKAKTK